MGGQCTPCRPGTQEMLKILTRIDPEGRSFFNVNTEIFDVLQVLLQEGHQMKRILLDTQRLTHPI
ncbi:MAG: NADH-ubiquinone oxidoreductase-F iron-sulfur binding region domain-containing protein [Anaerolineae bacterium]